MRPTRIAIALAAVTVAACSPADKPAPEYPTLESNDELAADAQQQKKTEAKAELAAAEQCIAAGVYEVTVAIEDRDVEVKGPSLKWCKSMLEGMGHQALRAMRIGYASGKMTVEWPNVVSVQRHDGCRFTLDAKMYSADVTFAADGGRGTVTYQVGSPNHPDEVCRLQSGKMSIKTPAAAVESDKPAPTTQPSQ